MDGAAKGSTDLKVAVGVGVGVGLMVLLLVALLLGLVCCCCWWEKRGRYEVKDDKEEGSKVQGLVSFSGFQNSGGKAPAPAF